MYIVDLAKKMQNKIRIKNQPIFNDDVEALRNVLNNYNEPLNLLERSYFQYKCQMRQLPWLFKAVQFCSSIILAPFLYIKYSSKDNINILSSNTAIFISGMKDYSYIPESLMREFNEIKLCDYTFKGILTKNDRKIVMKIYQKYWKNPFFCLKSMMKVALYSEKIRLYNPTAILTMAEYSFTSSILTYYCNKLNIEHINIMHGEKLFNIRDSFVKFNRYYVWDEYYVNLMTELRADSNQFRIEVPQALKLKVDLKDDYKYELTYYLGGESYEQLIRLRDTLKKIPIPVEKICIRLHPRYSDEKKIRELFCNFNIENHKKVDLETSLNSTRFVVSLYSTVLYQALINGKKVVIDDITDPFKFSKLRELRHIIIYKEHIKLSSLFEHDN